LDGVVVDAKSPIAVIASGGKVEIVDSTSSIPTAPIVAVPSGSKVRVKYVFEGSSVLRMIHVDTSATLNDFLKAIARGGVSGVSVKVDGCLISLDQRVIDYREDIITISSTPYDEPATQVVIPPVQQVVLTPPQLDLVFVIDATGSMEAAIKAAHDYAFNIARIFRINRKLQLRLGCVCYRDPMDSFDDIHQIHEFNGLGLFLGKEAEMVGTITLEPLTQFLISSGDRQPITQLS
jgi:hypothetical protein